MLNINYKLDWVHSSGCCKTEFYVSAILTLRSTLPTMTHNFAYFIMVIVVGLGGAHKISNVIKPKVLVTSMNVPQIAFDLLSDCCEVIAMQNETRSEILSKVKGVDALLWASHLNIDKDILNAAGIQMKTIGAMSAGYNHIDLAELKQRGIKMGNTPKVLNGAVADTAILLALGASRRMHQGRVLIESGKWNPNEWILGQDISGSTVGIIGLGGIGQAIARRLKVFEVEVILYTGHKEKPEGKELDAKFISLNDSDTLIKQSDFIFVSVPLTSETEGMCNADFFSKMKKTAVFINTSRGKVVDQKALVKALKEGQIFAAGLDVMTPEPLPVDDELLTLPNVVLMPHWGSATKKTRDAMAKLTAENIIRGLKGEEMLTPVV